MASPWHHPALAVAASHACPAGSGWHDHTAVPSVAGCHLTGSAAPKQQAQNIIHKQITDTRPLGRSWFQTLQTAESDTSRAKNSNYYCSNSSITNVLIAFLSNMATQITRHFCRRGKYFLPTGNRTMILQSPGLYPRQYTDYATPVLCRWLCTVCDPKIKCKKQGFFWLSTLYIKCKFIKLQDNWKILQTFMFKMHLEKYVCLHVTLLLLW